MKLLALTLLVVLSAACPALAQVHPRPPGLQQADQAEQQADKDTPPPASAQSRIDFAKLSHDADELAKIAQTIPVDVSSIQKGLLPRDTVEKLKQIEKLSKHLRSQIQP
ncbi:MAG: hypothetical protein ABSF97_16920 [Candidatus Sulfotelmatobacter sp.]